MHDDTCKEAAGGGARAAQMGGRNSRGRWQGCQGKGVQCVQRARKDETGREGPGHAERMAGYQRGIKAQGQRRDILKACSVANGNGKKQWRVRVAAGKGTRRCSAERSLSVRTVPSWLAAAPR